MDGEAIRDDMGQLVSDPAMKAAIVGFDGGGDRVLEVIEYLRADGEPHQTRTHLTEPGLSHIGLICDDIDAPRAELERRGVRFLVDGIADIAGVRTTWFADPWGVVFILVEKRKPQRPYFAQLGQPPICAGSMPVYCRAMAIGGVLFDIDGVLVTSWEPIPGASKTLRTLS